MYGALGDAPHEHLNKVLTRLLNQLNSHIDELLLHNWQRRRP